VLQQLAAKFVVGKLAPTTGDVIAGRSRSCTLESGSGVPRDRASWDVYWLQDYSPIKGNCMGSPFSMQYYLSRFCCQVEVVDYAFV
jgi:hypothetical protein